MLRVLKNTTLRTVLWWIKNCVDMGIDSHENRPINLKLADLWQLIHHLRTSRSGFDFREEQWSSLCHNVQSGFCAHPSSRQWIQGTRNATKIKQSRDTYPDFALADNSSHTSNAYIAHFSSAFLRFDSVVDWHAGICFALEVNVYYSLHIFYLFIYSHLRTREVIWDHCNCLFFKQFSRFNCFVKKSNCLYILSRVSVWFCVFASYLWTQPVDALKGTRWETICVPFALECE
jgi:hypothetical protein